VWKLKQLIFSNWYFLLAFLPLLGSVYIQREISAEQTNLLEKTSPMPLASDIPAPFTVTWVRDLGEDGMYGGTSKGLDFASRFGMIHAFDSSTGETVWSQSLDDIRILYVQDDVLIVRTFSDRYGLDLGTGRVLWHQDNITPDSYQTDFEVAKQLRSPLRAGHPMSPVTYHEKVAIVKENHFSIKGVDKSNNQVLWTFSTENAPNPIPETRLRIPWSDTLDDVAYVTLGEREARHLYAIDVYSGKIYWKTESTNLFDVLILAHTLEELFLSPLIVISRKTGEIKGSIDTGIPYPNVVVVDKEGLLIYGEVHGDSEPEVPNSIAGPGNKLLVRFDREIEQDTVAMRSQNWWATGDRFSAWYTIEFSLRNTGILATDSPLSRTCRLFLKEQLIDIQDSFDQQDYKRVTDNFTHYGGSQAEFVFHPLARLCPGAENLLAKGYFLAGAAFDQQLEEKIWYKYPFDNPYYRQLIRDLPETSFAFEATAKLEDSRRAFFIGWRLRQIILIILAIGMPLFFFYGLGTGNRVSIGIMIFFNLFIVGPWFDMTVLELHSLKAIWFSTGFGLRQMIGACIMGCGCISVLIFGSVTSTTMHSRDFSKATMVGIWFLNAVIILVVFSLMFPSPFN
jgi:hypothetical protein